MPPIICPACQWVLSSLEDVPNEGVSCPACGAAITRNRHRDSAKGDAAIDNLEPALPTGPYQIAGPSTSVESPPPTLPTIPGYEILEELGRGGMGVVYKASHMQLQRLVALKMILAGGHAGSADRARFRTEAEAIARLQHPNIVQVHELGEHEGKPYFSLEFCDGGSLAQKISGTPFPPQEAAHLVEKLARAMDYAHQGGVIHRDLKPANVLLSRRAKSLACPDEAAKQVCLSYEPKITDFGLAKKLDEAGQTASGAVLGTPSYMAPEQAGGKGKKVGTACDVYALGAILYELLTGRPPFRGDNPLETIRQVLSDDPTPPTQLQSKTPKDLETICFKCLQKEPHRRYATAAALAEDLRRFQTGEPILARRVGAMERAWKWAKRRPAAAALLAFLVLLLTTAGALLLVRDWVRGQALEGDICQALAEVERTHKQFGEMLVGFDKEEKKSGKTMRVFELQRDIDGWQTRLRQARANWIIADHLARANTRLVDPLLAGRIQAVGEKLKVDETGLGLAKELVDGKWGNSLFDFPLALAAVYCNQGDTVLFQQDNPKVALDYYKRAIQILKTHQIVPTQYGQEALVLKQAKRRRKAASFLLRGFTGTLSHFPVVTTRGALMIFKVEKVGPFPESPVRWGAPGHTKLVGWTWAAQAVHKLRMQVGRVYLIDLECEKFDTLSLQDARSEVLAESRSHDWISERNSRIIFTPKYSGMYRIVVSSSGMGMGEESPYRLTIGAFARSK
jgi:hypothetical protein